MAQPEILTHRAHFNLLRQEFEPDVVKFSYYFDTPIKFNHPTNCQEPQWWHLDVEELATRLDIIASLNALDVTFKVVPWIVAYIIFCS